MLLTSPIVLHWIQCRSRVSSFNLLHQCISGLSFNCTGEFRSQRQPWLILPQKADGEECSNGGFCRPNVTDPAEVCGSVCALPELGAKPCSCSVSLVPGLRFSCCIRCPMNARSAVKMTLSGVHPAMSSRLAPMTSTPPLVLRASRRYSTVILLRIWLTHLKGTTGFNDSTEIPTANHPFTSTCQPAHEVRLPGPKCARTHCRSGVNTTRVCEFDEP